MAADRASWRGIGLERRRLCEAHAVELNVVEGGRDRDFMRHKHRQAGGGLCELTDGGAEVDNTSRLGSRNRRIGKIEFRLVTLGFCLREVGDRAVVLRLQRLDLPLREPEGRLRTLQRSLLLMQLRGVLLGVLNGAVARLLQVLVALPCSCANTSAACL